MNETFPKSFRHEEITERLRPEDRQVGHAAVNARLYTAPGFDGKDTNVIKKPKDDKPVTEPIKQEEEPWYIQMRNEARRAVPATVTDDDPTPPRSQQVFSSTQWRMTHEMGQHTSDSNPKAYRRSDMSFKDAYLKRDKR